MGLIFLLLAGTGLALPGCSKQGEGERCSPTNGDEDCEEGLICTADRQSGSDFGRCCPPAGAPIGDSRCNFTPTTGTGGGSSSGGSSAGGNGTGGAGAQSSGEGGSGAMSSAGAGGNDDTGATGGTSGAGGGG